MRWVLYWRVGSRPGTMCSLGYTDGENNDGMYLLNSMTNVTEHSYKEAMKLHKDAVKPHKDAMKMCVPAML